jgi:hypothetical protein
MLFAHGSNLHYIVKLGECRMDFAHLRSLYAEDLQLLKLFIEAICLELIEIFSLKKVTYITNNRPFLVN